MVPIVVRSIIYNTPEAYVRRAIECVLNQTFSDFIYQILDNGCTDDTKSVIEEYAVRDPRIRLLRNTRNATLYPEYEQDTRYIMGPVDGVAEYICTIDSDDWYDLDFLEIAYKAAKEHNADIVVSDYEMISEADPSRTLTRLTKAGVFADSDSLVKYWAESYVSLRGWWSKLVRYDIWEEALSTPEAAFAGRGYDTFTLQEAVRRSKVIVSLGEAKFHYLDRIRSDKRSLSKNTKHVHSLVMLYKQSMDILSGFDLTAETAKYASDKFAERLRSTLINDELDHLYSAISVEPRLVMEYLEVIFTDPTILQVFDGFKEYRDEFNKVLDVALDIFAMNQDKRRIVNSFVTRLALLREVTNKFKSVTEANLGAFFSVIFDRQNIYNAGSFLLTDVLLAYEAPFAKVLPLLGDSLKDTTLQQLIKQKNSTELFAILLDSAFEKGNDDIKSGIMKVIKANKDTETLPDAFIECNQPETNMIFHGEHEKALVSLEERLDAALSAGDADEAERLLLSILRVSAILDSTDVFIQTRVRLLELFVITEQYDKARDERGSLEQLAEAEQMEEIDRITGFYEISEQNVNFNRLQKNGKDNLVRGCSHIARFELNFISAVDIIGQNVVSMCCNIRSDAPAVALKETGRETIQDYMNVYKGVIEESKDLTKPRVYTSGCAQCAFYQAGDWKSDGLIHFVNFSILPAPCQCRCIYCNVRNYHGIDENHPRKRPVSEGYEMVFQAMAYAKESGHIAPDASWYLSSGEITIHPYKDRILDLVKDHTTGFLTNGFVFDEKIGAHLSANPSSYINVSIDAGTRETWSKIKGFNNFREVLDNLTKYRSFSTNEKQITLKYIILPGINSSPKNYNGVIRIMGDLDINHLRIARNIALTHESDKKAAITSAVNFISILKNNGYSYNLEEFTPAEVKKIEELLPND